MYSKLLQTWVCFDYHFAHNLIILCCFHPHWVFSSVVCHKFICDLSPDLIQASFQQTDSDTRREFQYC